MRSWLNPVIAALDLRESPLKIFLRDDDGGWDDDRLRQLVDLCDRLDATLDLAAIPHALNATTGAWLAARIGDRLGCHQHGYTHANHATTGRKCEFGTERDYETQLADLREGWMLLERRLDGRADPIFTPPWNRCSQATVDALTTLGFRALSRDAGAAPLRLDDLRSIPVHVDWMKHRLGTMPVAGVESTPDRARLATLIAEACTREEELGLMLHHAVMQEADFEALAELLSTLRCAPNVEFMTMRALPGAHGSAAALRRSA
jgi:hypothetical protein